MNNELQLIIFCPMYYRFKPFVVHHLDQDCRIIVPDNVGSITRMEEGGFRKYLEAIDKKAYQASRPNNSLRLNL